MRRARAKSKSNTQWMLGAHLNKRNYLSMIVNKTLTATFDLWQEVFLRKTQIMDGRFINQNQRR